MPNIDFCLGCGQTFIGDEQLVDVEIVTRDVEWPEIALCRDCLTEHAADVGYAHIVDEVFADA